jgi:type IV pilus secretin PilQ/predicted competence protein
MKIGGIVLSNRVGVLMLLAVLLFILSLSVNAQEIKDAPRISMDFQQAKLEDVLKIFSQQAGLNFVATENIRDKQITLYLDGVTVQDALDSIMKANNLAYDQAPGSAVFVVRESGKAKVEMMTKVYTLRFARVSQESVAKEGSVSQVSDIKSILENLLSKGDDGRVLGNIVIDKRTNSIIVTTIPSDFPIIEDAINRLDAVTPQALIEAEIVEINTNALKNLGLEWGDQTDGTFVTFTGPSRSTTFPFERVNAPLQKKLIAAGARTATRGTLNLTDFAFVLKALEKEGMARYLAKPRIMTLNNETAEINISANAAVGVNVESQSDTGSVTESAERVDIGVILKVTPTINKEGYIIMTLEPEVSRAVQSPVENSRGQPFYDATKRAAKTTVMVRDGQTMAIGGLIQSQEDNSTSKTPGLSRIPLLGKLFKGDEKNKDDTEIIIFITAHAIQDIAELAMAKESQINEEAKPAAIGTPDADIREEEIKKTVMRLRKKREISK